MTGIHLKSLLKYYSNTPVVDNIDLVLADGEFTVLVGPSGCGKTTTLRLIAGLERPSAGDIFFDNVCVTHLPPRERDVAVVFQQYSLYGHLNIRENLIFGLKARKTPPDITRDRLKLISGLLKIDHLLERYPAQLSGGEQQRVAIGRALARNPKAFLFDEPLSNLDAALKMELRMEIIRLHQAITTTALYVTHDQAEAMSMADTLVVMDRGRILQAGPPMMVYTHPVNTFVASFIGSPPMNFFPGKIQKKNDMYFFISPMCTFRLENPLLPVQLEKPGQADHGFLTGIRPEHLSVMPPEVRGEKDRALPGNCFPGITGTLITAEYLGTETLLSIQCGNMMVRARTAGNGSVQRGEPVRLFFDPLSIYLFDAEKLTCIQPQFIKE